MFSRNRASPGVKKYLTKAPTALSAASMKSTRRDFLHKTALAIGAFGVRSSITAYPKAAEWSVSEHRRHTCHI